MPPGTLALSIFLFTILSRVALKMHIAASWSQYGCRNSGPHVCVPGSKNKKEVEVKEQRVKRPFPCPTPSPYSEKNCSPGTSVPFHLLELGYLAASNCKRGWEKRNFTILLISTVEKRERERDWNALWVANS